MTEEEIRAAIGSAIIQSGCYDDEERDVLQWHHCFDQPACPGNWRTPAQCACSGSPYVSDALWEALGPVIEKIVKEARP